MTAPLSPELYWLSLTALATALMWVPQIAWLIGKMGLVPALMDGEHAIDYTTAWAARANRAHRNAVENLAVFAALIACVEIAGVASDLTATAAAAFFWLRLGHFAVYVAGLPVVRTLLFAAGVACQVTLALAFLGAV